MAATSWGGSGEGGREQPTPRLDEGHRGLATVGGGWAVGRVVVNRGAKSWLEAFTQCRRLWETLGSGTPVVGPDAKF